MKLFRFYLIALLTMISFAGSSQAAELSAESLQGDWMFTHIIMDGEREMKVNRKMKFLADGTLVNYDAGGNEKSRAAFRVEGGIIVYTDEKGEQRWNVVSLDKDSLHVDHRGAEMFFERR